MERIYVEITNICNMRCSFCPGTSRDKRMMTPEEFALVAERISPHTKHVFLHLMGEPLMHPELDELISIAKKNGLTVSVTTNGTLLRSRGDILLKHAESIHKVSISLHSGESNGKKDENSAYLLDAINFAKKAADHNIFTVMRLWNLDSSERLGENRENAAILATLRKHYPLPWEERHSGWRIGERTFLECAEIFTWPTESNADPTETGRCYGLSRQLGILADGTVVPCCLDSEGAIPLGNIFSASLPEILTGERATKIREGFSKGKMHEPLCQSCTYARRFTK